MNTQTESENYLDVYEVMHHDLAGKNKDSFVEHVSVHLLTSFSSNVGEKGKRYTKLGIKKPPQIPICQRMK